HRTAPSKTPRDITIPQTLRMKLPDHRITPAECEIVREISRRGAGISYIAKHPEIEGYVLLKAFLPEYTVSEEVTSRWTRSCRMAEDVRHPRLARVLGVGILEGVPCMVREYIEGKTFEEMLGEGSLDLRQGLFWLAQALEGVEDAHGHRLIHGNIKPSNIILDVRGRPVVTDAGLYPPQDAPDTSEHLLSSLPYMAPEALADAILKPSADVYSAAAVLYDLAANRPPFAANSAADIRSNILVGAPVPPSQLNAKVSKMVEYLILQSLVRDPEQRYTSIHSFIVDAQRVYKGQKPLSYQEKRSPVLAAIKGVFYTLLFLALFGALGWGGLNYWRKKQHERFHSLLVQARDAYEKGDYNSVVDLALELSGTHLGDEAGVLQASALLGLKRPERALPVLDDVLRRGASPGLEVQARWLKTRTLIELGRFADARSAMQGMDGPLFERKVERAELETFVAGIVELKAAPPDKAEIRALLLSDLLPMLPQPPLSLLIKRAAARLTDNPHEAASLFRETLAAAGPEHRSTALAAASDLAALYASGKLQLAPDDAAILSAYPEALSGLGQDLMLAGRHPEADVVWRALADVKDLPETARRMLRLLDARKLEEAGSSSDALNRYLDLAARQDAAGLWALLHAARLRLNAGDTRSAASDFKNIENDANAPQALRVQAALWLGHCWRAQGRSDQALPFYRKVRESAPASTVQTEAMLAEIEALAETASAADGRRMLRSLRSLAPNSPLAAAAAYVLGEADALPQDIPRPHWLYMRALRLEVEQRWDDAHDAYRTVESEAFGKSWYGAAARVRKTIVKNR
ncbi:MAG TPA: tetratricopeptide repeat protein, partial [Planctomycetes bacterium]|nr:tetratricopeptide repeat protein [Planctomycetota bacterium]